MEENILDELIRLRNEMVEQRHIFADAIEVVAEKINVSKSSLRKVIEALAKHDKHKLQEEIDEICTLLNTHE